MKYLIYGLSSIAIIILIILVIELIKILKNTKRNILPKVDNITSNLDSSKKKIDYISSVSHKTIFWKLLAGISVLRYALKDYKKEKSLPKSIAKACIIKKPF